MKKSNDTIDEMIKKALSEEEAEFYDQLDEQSLPEMFTGLFQGKQKWLTILTAFMQLMLFIVAVICAVNFLQTEALREMIIWGAGFFLFFMAVTTLKMWHWMQIDKNALMREMKRLELQVAALASKIENKKRDESD
ncbi:MAG: DUF6768 family protein [Bacteroidota bacterium]